MIPSGETTNLLSSLAKKHGIFIVARIYSGVRDQENVQIFNTSLTFSPEGKIIAKHRKVHLFDIDIPGGITFKELVTLNAGDKATVFKIR